MVGSIYGVSNMVQLVEDGCERNKVTIPLDRGAFNVSNIVQLVEDGLTFASDAYSLFVSFTMLKLTVFSIQNCPIFGDSSCSYGELGVSRPLYLPRAQF